MRRSLRLMIGGRRSFTASAMPKAVKIVEVGPRDGLQNEKAIIPTQSKIQLIRKLQDAGLTRIEIGSFVSPKYVPQMADTSEIVKALIKNDNTATPSSSSLSVLTPNLKGFKMANELGVKEIAIFGSASEAFSKKNINCSIEESLKKFKIVCDHAKLHNMKVRGYVSCVLGCPYEGHVEPTKVAQLASHLLDLGCFEVSLGDTIGVGNPSSTAELLDTCLQHIDANQLAVHFHDTYAMSIANIVTALEKGITVIDSSVSGLGGCPYAKGASGNVATEDVIYLLDGLGIQHGVDMNKLRDAQRYIDDVLKRSSASKVARARNATDSDDNNCSGGSGSTESSIEQAIA